MNSGMSFIPGKCTINKGLRPIIIKRKKKKNCKKKRKKKKKVNLDIVIILKVVS